MPKKANSHPSQSRPLKKIVDANTPLNFPAIGATMSPYANQYHAKSAHKSGTPDTTLKPKHRFRTRKIIKRVLLLLLLVIILGGGWVGWKFLRDATKLFHGNIFGLFSSHQLNGESTGRVNILLAGDSADDPGHQGADLTDSIMVVSLDTKNDTGFMLSIPRDLWVNIPGFGYQKINAAYEDGQSESFSASGYPNGGMGLLEEVITEDFGIPINYYALIDYSAFRDAVNAVGGITVNIQSPDPRGLYDPNANLNLPNGEVTLTGQEALNLARARGDGYGAYGFPQADFDRTEHQRQMLVAVEQKALSAGVLSNPLKVGQLFDALGNNVQTDFQTNDVQSLYSILKKTNINNVQSLTFSESGTNPLLKNYETPDGQDTLIPTVGIGNYSELQAYYDGLVQPPTTAQ